MLEQQPTRLTIDGIIQLLSKSSFQGQSFVLQVLTLTQNYLGHHYTELSDGYCKIQCQLVSQAKELVQAEKLQHNGIIRFTTSSCQVISDNANPYIVLNYCQVIKPQLNKTIGAPMPYKLYKQKVHIPLKKNYQNPQASNLIESGPRTYSIQQVINNTRIKNGHIRATVTKLPNNTSRGLCIFNLKDSHETEIQAVCFEEAAQLFLKQLRLNQEYVFSGFVLNKNRKTNQDELKFKKQAQILRIVKTSTGQIFQKPPEPAVKHQPTQSFSAQLEQQAPSTDQNIITKQKLMQQIRQDRVNGKFFTIMGKVTYLNVKNMFRKINLQDQNNDIIDVILWQEVKDTLLIDRIYKVTDLRVKHKPDMKESKYVELHSSKKTIISLVDPLEFQLMTVVAKQQQHRPNTNNRNQPSSMQQPSRVQRTKKMPQHQKIITLQQLILLSQNQDNTTPSYPICQCTIKFRTEGLRFKDQADTLNYFNFFCGPCNKAGSVSLGDNDIVFCNRCKRDDVQIKWNLRVRVMDLKNQLPCSIQSETTERFLNLGPKEGFLLLMQSREEFQKLLHKVNFDNRVCKFQIKTHGVNKYFNILEVYAKDTQVMLDKHLAELRKLLSQETKVEETEDIMEKKVKVE